MKKNLLNKSKPNNSPNSIRNLKLNLKKKLNKRKNKKSKLEKIMPTCTNKLWLRMMPEMELIVEVAISKLLLINKQSRIMLLMYSQDLEICLTFLMLSQKTRKKKRKK